MTAGDWGALTALVRALLFMEMFIRAMAPHVKRELSFEEALVARAGEAAGRIAIAPRRNWHDAEARGPFAKTRPWRSGRDQGRNPQGR
jgi:hypothetical protein